MSDSVRPHRRQPTRLRRPWDSPGKNTGVGCHFLLQCMKVKSDSEVAQSCLTLCNPMYCIPSCSSIREILQARVLEWGDFPGGPVAKTLCSQCRGLGFHPYVGTTSLEKGMATHSSILAWRIPQRSLAVYCPRVTKSQTGISN